MIKRAVRLVIGGASGVGKTCLLVQLTQHHFVEPHYPTDENLFFESMAYKGKEYRAEFVDTCGQNESAVMTHANLFKAHGHIVVYSVVDRGSFETAKTMCQSILNARRGVGKGTPIVLVANKIDLDNAKQIPLNERVAMAKELGLQYIETSVKAGLHVEHVFALLAEQIEKRHFTPIAQDCVIC